MAVKILALMLTFSMILVVISGYICAKAAYVIFRKTWLSVAMVLATLITPLSFTVMFKSWKYDSILGYIFDFGYFYLGFVVYFSMYCVLAYIIHKFKDGFNYRKSLQFGLIFTGVILFGGYLNAINPQLKRITIPSNVNAKICFVSDIHVGSINTSHRLSVIAELIDEAKPDFVLIGGDTIDIKSIEKYGDEFVKKFSEITKKYKTYAVIGNHELYAGVDDCITLMRKAGIHMLLDSAVPDGDFVFVGRLENSIRSRKSIAQILGNKKGRLIVIDHNPQDFDDPIKNRALLYLAGHTHGGQMFPFNIVTNLLYKPTGELMHLDDTYCYISYGAGFWGPPYRIGNHPEVVSIEIQKTQ